VDKTRGGPDVQQAALLRTHLLMARQLELPLILHQVGMRKVLLDCLREVGLSDRGGVVHGFSGDLAWGKALIQRGFLLGIGAGIIRKGRGRLREAVAQLPLDRMVLETDAPDQGPKSGMQAQNTGRPSDLRAVAERLAELKGVSLDLVATTTTKAACECFAIQLLEDPAST
jgi:TatD DNase family protein